MCPGRLRASPPVTGSRCTLAVLVLINISAVAGSHATGPRPLPNQGLPAARADPQDSLC